MSTPKPVFALVISVELILFELLQNFMATRGMGDQRRLFLLKMETFRKKVSANRKYSGKKPHTWYNCELKIIHTEGNNREACLPLVSCYIVGRNSPESPKNKPALMQICTLNSCYQCGLKM